MPDASLKVSIDPMEEAYKVYGGGHGDMLQVCLGVTEITRSPEVKGPHALRDRGLNSGPHTVKAGECARLLTLPGRLQGDVFVSCPERHETPFRGRSSTIGPV